VAASDPNHPNPYLFTGRRFDRETGLYYYRARYYNPYIGRFLQTDPVGYADGINWYLYCSNNPVNFVDASGKWVSTYHWQLTYDAMKACGLSTFEAGYTASANENVDREKFYTTHLPGVSSAHYLKGQQVSAEKLIRDEMFKAVEAGNRGDHVEALWHLGRALHTAQDKHAHHDQGINWLNHWVSGNDPDNPDLHPREYNDAYNNAVALIELFQRLVSGEPDDVDEFFDAYDEWIDGLEEAEEERREDE